MDGCRRVLLLLVLCCCAQRGLSADIAFSVQPEKLILSPEESVNGGVLTLTCGLTGLVSGDTIILLQLKRKPPSDSDSNAAQAIASWFENQIQKTTDIKKLTVTNTTTATSRSMVITMGETKCEDARDYICGASILAGSVTSSPESVKTVQVEVTPGNITLSPTIEGGTDFVEGVKLELLCNGRVGSVVDGQTELKWNWDFKDEGEGWQPYNGTLDIKNDEIVQPNDRCYKAWSSTLTRVLTLEDSNREYRCYITRDKEDWLEFAKTYTVGIVFPEGFTTTPPPDSGGDGDSGASKANVGAIVGGLIGALVVVIVIIVIIVFVVRRRSSKPEENHEGSADANKPPEDPHMPAYTAGPGTVTYSQPNRFRNSRETRQKEEEEEEDGERERGGGGGGRRNAEGLHYAELDLVRPTTTTHPHPHPHPRHPLPSTAASDEENASHNTSRTTPTEYASIRLF